jgi:phage-related protein
VWMGNAKRNLRAFPEGAQKGEKLYVLHAFQRVQEGQACIDESI